MIEECARQCSLLDEALILTIIIGIAIVLAIKGQLFDKW